MSSIADEDFMIENAGNSCLSTDKDIIFQAWRLNWIRFSPKACHHMLQYLPKNIKVLCEDKNSSTLATIKD